MWPVRPFAMLTVLLAGGCDPGGPNGKRGQLFFTPSLEPVAAGLALDVMIP